MILVHVEANFFFLLKEILRPLHVVLATRLASWKSICVLANRLTDVRSALNRVQKVVSLFESESYFLSRLLAHHLRCSPLFRCNEYVLLARFL